MSTTIQFFNTFIYKNGQPTNLSVPDFLDKIIPLHESVRYVRNIFGDYSLIDMLMPNQNPNNNFLDRIVNFANYRDKKPFSGQKGTDLKNEISGDIFELTTCLFIPAYHLAVMEYNHFGARPKHIEKYLNSFLPISEGWSFNLIPIETDNSMRNIINSSEIKNIEIKLDLLSSEANLFNNSPDELQSITSALNTTIESFRHIGANVATFNLGQGRRKNNMNLDDLILLLQTINNESDSIASLRVKYKNSNTNKTDIIDLKNAGYLKRVILEGDNSTAFESIGMGISKYYYEQSNRIASDSFRKHVTELVSQELPTVKFYSEPDFIEDEVGSMVAATLLTND